VPVRESRARMIQAAAYLLGGALLLGAFLFMGFSGFRSLAIVLALVAVVIARYLYVTLPERLNPTDNPEDEAGIDQPSEAAQDEG
jgi:hypothetical protein